MDAMRIMIPVRKGRVSPVFDVARRVLIVDVGESGEVELSREWLEQVNGHVQPGQLVELGTDLLICGVMTSSLEEAIMSAGITIVGQVCGAVHEILRAFLRDAIGECDFLIPGHVIRATRYCNVRSLCQLSQDQGNYLTTST
jgi:predicted Fe-Mo cluster-binding NifX family protein